MKRFILKLFLFLGIFYLITFFLQELVFYCARKIEVEEWGKRNKIVNGQINADIIITGTSRAFGHFNPAIISEITRKKTYNMGGGGTAISAQLPLLRSYLRHNRPPQVIVYNADYQAVGFETLAYDPFYDLPYMSDQEIYQGRLAVDKYFWLHRYIPAYNLYYFNTLKQYELWKALYKTIFSKPDSWTEGYCPYDGELDMNTAIGKIVQKYPDAFVSNFSKANYDYLIEMITICQRRKIQFILVSSPQYYEFFPYQQNRNEIMRVYRGVAKEHNLIYLDYSDHPLSREKNLFSGVHHLNKQGAETFSKRFAKDLLDIFRKGQSSGRN